MRFPTKLSYKSHFLLKMERETRLELATPTLARLCSTTELFPRDEVTERFVSLQKQRVDYRDAVRFVKKRNERNGLNLFPE